MKDKQIEKLMKAEEARQKGTITLIASENYVSDDVLKALGSKFTNKYSEGYPHKRYYKGQTNTDKLEELAQGYLDFGSAQLIYKLEDGYLGASDPRRDGQAVGF